MPSSSRQDSNFGPQSSRPAVKATNEKDTLNLFISAGFGEGFAAAPKVLGDLFESIVGAIYIDSGGDLEILWQVTIIPASAMV